VASAARYVEVAAQHADAAAAARAGDDVRIAATGRARG
jgi:hypothetical protein